MTTTSAHHDHAWTHRAGLPTIVGRWPTEMQWPEATDVALAELRHPTVHTALALATTGGVAVLPADSTPLTELSHHGGDEDWVIVALADLPPTAFGDHADLVAEHLDRCSIHEVHHTPSWKIIITAHA